jgi:divalent metal cation (Fe/Co/Zn/Cd) transporter
MLMLVLDDRNRPLGTLALTVDEVVTVTLGILAVTAILQAAIYVATGSIALLADLIHNAGDALTALPLGAAFLLCSRRAERWAGFAVVLTILASALTAAVFVIERIVHPL